MKTRRTMATDQIPRVSTDADPARRWIPFPARPDARRPADEPGVPGPRRPKHTAAERGAQRSRAQIRATSHILKGVEELYNHRGSYPTRIAKAMATAFRQARVDRGRQVQVHGPWRFPERTSTSSSHSGSSSRTAARRSRAAALASVTS